MPFWTLWNGHLHFCYWRDSEWFAELATTDVPPHCVQAPDILAIRKDRSGPQGNKIYHLKPCGTPRANPAGQAALSSLALPDLGIRGLQPMEDL